MGEVWEWIKSHPYISAAIVFVLGLILVLMFTGNSSAPNNAADANAAAAQAASAAAQSGNQLQALQSQLQAAGNQTNAEAAVAGQSIAADLSKAQLAQVASMHATDAAVLVAGLNAHTAEVTSTAAVTVNANNNATSFMSRLLDSISLNSQMQGPGGLHTTDYGTISTGAQGKTISAGYSLVPDGSGGFVGSFTGGNSYVPTAANGQSLFYTDPSGRSYGLHAGSDGSNIPGSIYAGNNSFYTPIAPNGVPTALHQGNANIIGPGGGGTYVQNGGASPLSVATGIAA